MSAVGFPRNLRGPVVSARYTGARGSRLIQVPLACGGCARPPAGANDEREQRYCQAKDDEVRQDGRQGVGAPPKYW